MHIRRWLYDDDDTFWKKCISWVWDNIVYNILTFFYYTCYRNCKIGFKNLFTWFWVIWNDRNWDYCYLLKIMRKKLTLMEDRLRYGNYVGCEKDADDIKICMLLIDRITADNYNEKEFDKFYKKWGDLLLDKKYIAENVKDDDEELQAQKELKKLFKQEEYSFTNDLEFLCNTLKKMRKWWD